MTKDEFLNFLKENNIQYTDEVFDGRDRLITLIYIKGTPVDIIAFNGEKKKYTPYLRVSHFGDRAGMAYTRQDGLVGWRTDDWIYKKCLELSKTIVHKLNRVL